LPVKEEQKPLTTAQKVVGYLILGLLALLALFLLYLFFFEEGFRFREEDRLDKVVNYVFIPILVAAILLSLAAKSLGAVITAILVCSIIVYPMMESVVMFFNVHIGPQTEELISGEIVDVHDTGNKHITVHVKVKTKDGLTYTFMDDSLIKDFNVHDQFDYHMRRGYFGILYRQFKKKE